MAARTRLAGRIHAGVGWYNDVPDISTQPVIHFMPKVIMYCTEQCPFCVMAERLLLRKGVNPLEKIRVDRDSSLREQMVRITGRRTVPQIFIGDVHVGGYDDLSALERRGQLDELLKA